ncbi:MAG TPA: PadR family transcriptional regulator [Candidatus Binatia bacterium]|nr:PadR family transcriptional regulator [Candidatus Binatia bacterium]
MFRFVVLGLLYDGQPRHGYAVAKEYGRRSGLRMNTGSFYRELQRLAADGLVRAVDNPPDADCRRTPYVITTAGRGAFETWLSSTRDAWGPGYEDALSSRALFLGDAAPAILDKVLERWSDALWSLVKAIERDREPSPIPADDARAAAPTLSLLQARRLRHLAVELEFLEEFRSAYRRPANAEPSQPSGSETTPARSPWRRVRDQAGSAGSPEPRVRARASESGAARRAPR